MTFRLARIDDRPGLLDDHDGWHDLERLGSAQGAGSLPDADALHRLSATLDPSSADGDLESARASGRLGSPIPIPRNSFAIGLNYGDHAAESSIEVPETPLVFTKFPSCISGPDADVELRSSYADWEVELVVIIGSTCRDVAAENAWDHVFGLTVGQDISDRALQFAAQPPHFDLGKSRDGYGPIGPVVVSLDAVEDHTDLAITCDINGTRRQDSRTSSMLFDVPTLIEYLSGILTLEPGDIIFTGTPDGVGAAQKPPVFLQAGDTIVSTIEGIGTITNRCV